MSLAQYILEERNKNGGKVINLMHDAYHEGTVMAKERKKIIGKPLDKITDEEAEISLEITKAALELLLAFQKADKLNAVEMRKLREEQKRIKEMEKQINKKVSIFDEKGFRKIKTI